MSRRRSVSMETLTRSDNNNDGPASRLVAVDIDIDGHSPIGPMERQRLMGGVGVGQALVRQLSQQDLSGGGRGGGGVARPMSAVDGDLAHKDKGVKVAPLNSIRLRPIRQEASNAVVSSCDSIPVLSLNFL